MFNRDEVVRYSKTQMVRGAKTGGQFPGNIQAAKNKGAGIFGH